MKLIKVAEAHLLELLATALAVTVVIVIGNERQADGDLWLQTLRCQIAEVGYDAGIVQSAIAAVDGWREVFHVDIIVVYVGSNLLQTA